MPAAGQGRWDSSLVLAATRRAARCDHLSGHRTRRGQRRSDQRLLGQLLDPLQIPRTVLDEIDPKPRGATQPVDLQRWNKRAAQHPPLAGWLR
jgi:hypothetical protein